MIGPLQKTTKEMNTGFYGEMEFHDFAFTGMVATGLVIQWKYVANTPAAGTLSAMKTSVTVDEVGRLVLPKNVREAIGISGRMAVNVEVVGQAARISAPESAAGPVERKRGRLVFTGPLPANWDSGEAVLKMREQRSRR